MSNSDFVQYLPPDCHDGILIEWVQDGADLTVRIKDFKGRLEGARFRGVTAVTARRPEGMVLYSLTEMRYASPLRRFLFVPWDESEDRSLEIIAEEEEPVDLA